MPVCTRLGSEEVLPDHVLADGHRHVPALHARARGRFDADEAAADHAQVPGSGREPGAAIKIHQRDATLWVGRPGPGQEIVVPEAPFVHVYLARGDAGFTARLEEGLLEEGDALRLADEEAVTLLPGPDGAELLVWETHSQLQ